ncbi:MAG: hypothetical protein ACJ72I_18610 [Pseudonocardiaceae bacterium]
MSSFWRNRGIFGLYVLSLMRPGHPPPVHFSAFPPAGDVTSWTESDIDTLIHVGERQMDRVLGEVDTIRLRAQVGFTTALLLNGFIASQLPVIRTHAKWIIALYSVAWLCTFMGLVGCLACFIIQIRVGTISAHTLSNYGSDSASVRSQLAQDYVGIATDNQATRDSLLTVLRESMLWLTVGAAGEALAWLIIQL